MATSLSSGNNNISKIQQLRSTFEKEIPPSPKTQVIKSRITLQNKLNNALCELEKYQNENEILLKENNLYKEEIYKQKEITDQMLYEISQLKEENLSIKNNQHDNKQKIGELININNQLNEKIKQEERKQSTNVNESIIIMNKDNNHNNGDNSDNNDNNIDVYKQKIKEYKNIINDKEKEIEKYNKELQLQISESKDLKKQVISVIELAETLENQITKEKQLHNKTKQELDLLISKNIDNQFLAEFENSISDTNNHSLRYDNRAYSVDEPSPTNTIEIIDIYQSNSDNSSPIKNNNKDANSSSIPLRNISIKSRSNHNKRKSFLSKFGKSQTKIRDSLNERDLLPLTNKIKHKKRKTRSNPKFSTDHSKPYPAITDPATHSILQEQEKAKMSYEALIKELDVLIVLGETLSETLQKEKKAHFQTKLQLEETEKLLSDLEKNKGISQLIKHKSRKSLSNVLSLRISQEDLTKNININPLKDIENELQEFRTHNQYHFKDRLLSDAHLDIYEIENTIKDMIDITNYLIITNK